jgi:hypothetical protein
MSGFVYKWTNLEDGMMYIGSHRGTVDDGYIGGGVYFTRAYKKNPESFIREIIYEGDSFREIEEQTLLELDCASSSLYYNLKNAAIGGDTYSYASEDVKKRMAHGKNKSATYHNIRDKDAWLEKMRAAQQDPELRRARSERMKGKRYSARYDLSKVWEEIKSLYLQGTSYNEIKRLTGYSRGTIYRAKKQNE